MPSQLELTVMMWETTWFFPTERKKNRWEGKGSDRCRFLSTLLKVEIVAFFVQYPLWSYPLGHHILLLNLLKMAAILQNPEPEEDGWFIRMGTPWR